MRCLISILGIALLTAAMATDFVFAQFPVEQRYLTFDDGRGGHTLIVAPVQGANEFRVYSSATGHWSDVVFPDGVSAAPIMDRGVCAFRLGGERITHLVAVGRNGHPSRFQLPQPVNAVGSDKVIFPTVADKVAVFVVDGRAHAFSGETGRWDSIDAPATPELLSNDTAVVVASDWIGAFSPKVGKWAIARTKQ